MQPQTRADGEWIGFDPTKVRFTFCQTLALCSHRSLHHNDVSSCASPHTAHDPSQINPLDDPAHPLHNVILSERHKETFPPYTPYKGPRPDAPFPTAAGPSRPQGTDEASAAAATP